MSVNIFPQELEELQASLELSVGINREKKQLASTQFQLGCLSQVGFGFHMHVATILDP